MNDTSAGILHTTQRDFELHISRDKSGRISEVWVSTTVYWKNGDSAEMICALECRTIHQIRRDFQTVVGNLEFVSDEELIARCESDGFTKYKFGATFDPITPVIDEEEYYEDNVIVMEEEVAEVRGTW